MAAAPARVEAASARPSRNSQPRPSSTRLALGSTLPKGRGKKMMAAIAAIQAPHQPRVRSCRQACQRGPSQRSARAYSQARACRLRRDPCSFRVKPPSAPGRATRSRPRAQDQPSAAMKKLTNQPAPPTGMRVNSESTITSTGSEASPCRFSSSASVRRSGAVSSGLCEPPRPCARQRRSWRMAARRRRRARLWSMGRADAGVPA